MKTREEVDALKRNWIFYPHWDIETTEGFDEYKDELSAFRKEKQARWAEVREREEQARYMAQYDRRLAEAAERQAAALERIAAVLESVTNNEMLSVAFWEQV